MLQGSSFLLGALFGRDGALVSAQGRIMMQYVHQKVDLTFFWNRESSRTLFIEGRKIRGDQKIGRNAVSPQTIVGRKCLLLPCLIGILAASQTAVAQVLVKILPVTTQWQETDEWCWAASGQMLMNLIGADHLPPNVPQCYEANQEFSRSDCCACPTASACANPGWPQFSTWGFTSSQTACGTPLSWTDVKGQTDSGMPFMFSWAWNGGGAHAMVAKGYVDITLPPPFPIPIYQAVVMANPWSWQGRCGPGGNAAGPFGGDIEIIPYSEFAGGPGYDHTHGADIYNIKHQ
jgi:hypothetical protein